MVFIILFAIIALGIVFIPGIISSVREAQIRKTVSKERKYEGDSQGHSALDMGAGGTDISGGSSDSGGYS
jgi:hypothetical protein